MPTLKSLKTGLIMAARNWKMLMLFYAFNLLIAFAIMLPLRTLLLDFFGTRLASNTIATGFSFNYIFEMILAKKAAIGPIIQLGFIWGLLYFFMSTFLAGGAIAIYIRFSHRFFFAEFISNCGVYFGRFLRLFLTFLVFLIGILAASMILSGIFKLILGDSPNEGYLLLRLVIRIGIFMLLFLPAVMLFDYAKIITVIDNKKSVLGAIRNAVGFIWRHKRQSSGLFLSLLGIGLVVLIIYWLASDAINPASGRFIALLFLLQQVYIAIRIWIKLSFYSSQMLLYQAETTVQGDFPVEDANFA